MGFPELSLTLALAIGFLAVVLVYWSWRARPPRSPLLLASTGGALVLALAYGIAYGLGQGGQKTLPDMRLATLEGQEWQLAAWQGKPMVINLWATWCPPCRREMPLLEAGQKNNPDIHFVFANQGEEPAVVRAYLEEEGLDLHNVIIDAQRDMVRESASQGLPTTLFVDAHGRLRAMRLGELDEKELSGRLARLRRNSGITLTRKD